MRIISGQLKGQHFNTTRSHRTHPMSERVKSAIFNSIGDISDTTVLDAYAGTGALCFEALSRGAKSALALEIDARVAQVLRDNVAKLGLEDRCSVTRVNCRTWSRRNDGAVFDIVFCDPPFDALDESVLSELVHHVNQDGIMIVSFSSRLETPAIEGADLVDCRVYGDQSIGYYKVSS